MLHISLDLPNNDLEPEDNDDVDELINFFHEKENASGIEYRNYITNLYS